MWQAGSLLSHLWWALEGFERGWPLGMGLGPVHTQG